MSLYEMFAGTRDAMERLSNLDADICRIVEEGYQGVVFEYFEDVGGESTPDEWMCTSSLNHYSMKWKESPNTRGRAKIRANIYIGFDLCSQGGPAERLNRSLVIVGWTPLGDEWDFADMALDGPRLAVLDGLLVYWVHDGENVGNAAHIRSLDAARFYVIPLEKFETQDDITKFIVKPLVQMLRNNIPPIQALTDVPVVRLRQDAGRIRAAD